MPLAEELPDRPHPQPRRAPWDHTPRKRDPKRGIRKRGHFKSQRLKSDLEVRATWLFGRIPLFGSPSGGRVVEHYVSATQRSEVAARMPSSTARCMRAWVYVYMCMCRSLTFIQNVLETTDRRRVREKPPESCKRNGRCSCRGFQEYC